MVKCEDCGILKLLYDGNYQCYCFDKVIENEELSRRRYCHMFISKILEEDFNSEDYLILKQGEIQDKK